MVNKAKDANHLVNKLIQITNIITNFQVNKSTNAHNTVLLNIHKLKMVVMNVNNLVNTFKNF